MKWNSRAIMLSVLEYVAWLCPPVAYCIYSYVSTLQYVLDKKAVVSFWVSFSCVLVGVIFGATLFKRVKAAYARYVAAFVLHLPAPMIFLFLSSESIVKSIVGAIRVLSGKWLHEVT